MHESATNKCVTPFDCQSIHCHVLTVKLDNCGFREPITFPGIGLSHADMHTAHTLTTTTKIYICKGY